MGATSTTAVTILTQTVFGNKRIHLVEFACSVYGSDGIIITAALCGLSVLDYAIPIFVGDGSVTNGPVSAWWDQTNSLIKLLKASNTAVDEDVVVTDAGSLYAVAIGS